MQKAQARVSRRDLLKLGAVGAARVVLPPLPDPARGEPSMAPSALPAESPLRFAYGRALFANVPIYAEPNRAAQKVRSLAQHEVIAIRGEVKGEAVSRHNATWYEVEGGFVHSAGLCPTPWQLQPPRTDAGEAGFWAEVSVPFVVVHRGPSLKARRSPYRYYGGAVFKVVHVWPSQDSAGEAIPQGALPFGGQARWWYQVEDEIFPGAYYVPAEYLRPIPPEEFAPIAPDVDPLDKRIVIDLREQRLHAYERSAEVFSCRVATGAVLRLKSSGASANFTTTPGEWVVYRKTPSQHMYGGAVGNDGAFDLPGVPWVSYFTPTGIAIHGVYWHNDFGIPRSHGCVNAPTEAARWLWRWTLPAPDYSERYITLPPKERRNPQYGTRVSVLRSRSHAAGTVLLPAAAAGGDGHHN